MGQAGRSPPSRKLAITLSTWLAPSTATAEMVRAWAKTLRALRVIASTPVISSSRGFAPAAVRRRNSSSARTATGPVITFPAGRVILRYPGHSDTSARYPGDSSPREASFAAPFAKSALTATTPPMRSTLQRFRRCTPQRFPAGITLETVSFPPPKAPPLDFRYAVPGPGSARSGHPSGYMLSYAVFGSARNSPPNFR